MTLGDDETAAVAFAEAQQLVDAFVSSLAPERATAVLERGAGLGLSPAQATARG